MSFITGLHSLTIPVADLKPAIKWYVDVLGARRSDYAMDTLCRLEFPSFSAPIIQLVEVDEASRLRLAELNGRPLAAFTLACSNAKMLYERMRALGQNIHEFVQDEDDDGKCAFVFEDLDGNVLAVTDIFS